MSTILAVVTLIVPPAVATDGECDLLLEDVEVPVTSGATLPLDRNNNVNVVLPVGYCDSGLDYPVVLLLHGAGDTYETWVENTDVEDFVWNEGLPVIVVMPDGGKSGDPQAPSGWYTDWVDGRHDWETFHTQDVVTHVEGTYRTTERWAVAGLSMGGFGAMKYLGRHPGIFEAGASFSGALDTMYGWPVQGIAYAALQDRFGTPDERIWGDHVTDRETWQAHNPADLARDGAYDGKTVLVTTGTGTPGGHAGDDPANPGGYGIEHFVWQLTTSFVANLTLGGGTYNPGGGHPAAGPAPADWFYPGGLHSWPYWESAVHWALPRLAEAVGSTQPAGA